MRGRRSAPIGEARVPPSRVVQRRGSPGRLLPHGPLCVAAHQPRGRLRERHDRTELEIVEGWPLGPREVAPPAGSKHSTGGEDEHGLVKPEALVVLSQLPTNGLEGLARYAWMTPRFRGRCWRI